MNVVSRKRGRAILFIFSFIFIIWGLTFIYKSSFIAIDGKRYFSLFDDAMISMRYAWNFSHGFGLIWNHGEYVQGYTNLLMTLLMSFSTFIFNKSVAVLFIQIVGVGLILAIAYVNMLIANYVVVGQRESTRIFIGIISFCCAFAYYPLVYWTLMGMETGLLTLLLLLGILFAFRYVESKKPLHLFWMSGILGLAFLTRNDSAIFAMIVWVYIVWETLVPISKFNRIYSGITKFR